MRSFLRPSLLVACVLTSGCGPAPEPEARPSTTQAQELRWPRWIRIVAADVVGAVDGGYQGSKVGGSLGNKIEGTVTGAINGGAQASSEKAAQLTTTKGVTAGRLATLGPSNENNPYDGIGQHHNKLLDATVSVIGPDGCIRNPFPFPFPRKTTRGILWDYARVVLKTPAELLDAPEFEEAWNDTLDFAATADEEDITLAIEKRVKSGKMTAAVGGRIASYFTAVAPLDTDGLIKATHKFEEQTLKDEKLEEEERISLLGAYSVARYSATYWAEQAARGTDSPWCACAEK